MATSSRDPPTARPAHSGERRSRLRLRSSADFLLAARQHLKIGEVEQAAVQYRRALAVAPSFEAQLGLADGERLAGRDDLAAKEYERALRLDPRGAAALLPLARIYGRHARTRPQAEGRYRAYLEVRPGDAEAQLELGRLLAWQGKAADAVELLARRVTRRAITRGLGGLVDAIPFGSRGADAPRAPHHLEPGFKSGTLAISVDDAKVLQQPLRSRVTQKLLGLERRRGRVARTIEVAPRTRQPEGRMTFLKKDLSLEWR